MSLAIRLESAETGGWAFITSPNSLKNPATGVTETGVAIAVGATRLRRPRNWPAVTLLLSWAVIPFWIATAFGRSAWLSTRVRPMIQTFGVADLMIFLTVFLSFVEPEFFHFGPTIA